MGLSPGPFNLTIGKRGLPYQDVISLKLIHRNALMLYSIPSMRGSQSDSSGT